VYRDLQSDLDASYARHRGWRAFWLGAGRSASSGSRH